MIDEIFDKVSKMVSGEIPNGKFQIARMYGAFEREQEQCEIIDKFRERVSKMILDDIILISENEAICIIHRKDDMTCTKKYQPVILSNYQNLICETLDEAMIVLICMRNNCVEAAKFMMKLVK